MNLLSLWLDGDLTITSTRTLAQARMWLYSMTIQILKLTLILAHTESFYLLAFSSGVFVSALIKDKLPKLSLTVAANGNINLFDQNLGLDDFIVKLF